MDEYNNYNPQQPEQQAAQQQYQQQYQQYYQQPYQQQSYQQQPYQQQPLQQQPLQQIFYQSYDPTKEVMSVGAYIGMFILSAIPVINVICWIVWLCSSNTNKNKKNYVKANIVLWLLTLVIAIIFVVTTGVSIGALANM